MALDLFTPDGLFNPSTTGFTIINSYSTKGRSNNTRSVPPDIIFPSSALPTLTLGDLNIHHPTADPLRSFKEEEIATSSPYFDRAPDLGFSLLNTPGVFTRFSMALIGRRSVLDLAFACLLLAPYFLEWSDPLPSTGSDHIPILLRFEAPLFLTPPPDPQLGPDGLALLGRFSKIHHYQAPSPPPYHALPRHLVQHQPGQSYVPIRATHPPEKGNISVQALVVRAPLGTQKGLRLSPPLLEA